MIDKTAIISFNCCSCVATLSTILKTSTNYNFNLKTALMPEKHDKHVTKFLQHSFEFRNSAITQLKQNTSKVFLPAHYGAGNLMKI